jgi:hypothetical protein
LIEERDGKKLDASSVNLSSSTYAISFTQTNPHPSAQPMNHFHSQTIEDSAPTFGMPQQTTTNMFGQGYTHITPSFFMPNPGLAPYTSGYN